MSILYAYFSSQCVFTKCRFIQLRQRALFAFHLLPVAATDRSPTSQHSITNHMEPFIAQNERGLYTFVHNYSMKKSAVVFRLVMSVIR